MPGDLKFGCNPAASDECFDGFLRWMIILDSWIDDEMLKSTLLKGVPSMPVKGGAAGVFTTDGRSCLSQCEEGNGPAREEAKKADTPEAKEEEKMETVEEEKEEEEKAKEEKQEEENPAAKTIPTKKGDMSLGKEKAVAEEKMIENGLCKDGGSAEASCNLTLDSPQFAEMKSGTKDRMCCPAGCMASAAAIV